MGIAWLDPSSYPFADHYLDTPDGRLHYVDEGAGPPVVMVHGNPTWSFLYRHLIVRLRDSHRCLAPDHLGFGLSDKPVPPIQDPRVHARNLGSLIDALDLRDLTLVVQDWGGPIGLSFALDHPERVARLVILNTWMWSVRDQLYYQAYSALMGGPIGRFLVRRYNFFARAALPMAYADRSRLTPEIHRHYVAPLETPEQREASAVFARQVTRASDWLESLWNRREMLRPIPKLIVWGMQDPAFREKELARWEAAFPDARVIRLGDAGHFVQEEAPERLAEAVAEFLG